MLFQNRIANKWVIKQQNVRPFFSEEKGKAVFYLENEIKKGNVFYSSVGTNHIVATDFNPLDKN